MTPETIPLISDFKKEYKFLWLITADTSLASGNYAEAVKDFDVTRFDFKEMSEGTILYDAVVANPAFSGYISQLAEQVTLPDDEFEEEEIPQGPVVYPMPKRVKLPDIHVTYLEDSLESVYNFHKAWFQAIRCGRGVGINSPSQFCASARYIPFEDTMTAIKYALFKNQVVQQIKSSLYSSYISPNLPLGAVPTSITTYPSIYPKQIHRSAANHGGTEISKVEVTYARIPQFQKTHTALQMWDNILQQWNNKSYVFND